MKSWMKRPATRILLGVIIIAAVIGIIVYFVSVHIGSDEGKYVSASVASLLAAIAAMGSLLYAIEDANTRMRPIISVENIQQTSSLGPDGQAATIPYQMDAFYVVVHNTGVVPAEDIHISAILSDTTCNNPLKEAEAKVPVLAPSGKYRLSLLQLPGRAQAPICAGTAQFQIVIKYRGFGRKHKTILTYSIFLNRGAPLVDPESQIFLFQPVAPSSIS